MMLIWSNIAVVALALVSGWVALWPTRNRLGPWGYHLLAIPVGLLAWAIVPVATSLSDQPYGWTVVAIGHLIWVAVIALAGWVMDRLLPQPAEVRAVRLVSWAAAGAALLAVATVLGYVGLTAVQFDSLYHYHLPGIWLLNAGQIDKSMMAAYGVFIPSLNAATLLFEGEWTYLIYPVLSVLGLSALFGVLYADAFQGLRRAPRIGMSIIVTLVLAVMPNWVTHSFYAHSNMMSTVYLMFAVVSLAMASGFAGRRHGEGAWALLAGLSTVGYVLVRPDGLAFLFVVIALALVLLLGERISEAAYAVFCGSALIPITTVYAVGLVEVGLWESKKLTGAMALALLGAALVVCVAGWALSRVPEVGPWLARGYNAVRMAVAVNIVIVAVVLYRLREKSVPELSNMLGNLTDHGGWGFFWFAAAGIIVLSLLFAEVTRRSKWSGYLLYLIAQFFFMCVMVYGLTDPGRLGWQDSFSRASLAIVPIVFWYVGTFLGSLTQGSADDDGVEPL